MSDTKKCPFCAEDIKAEAIVCRFCGRNLPDDSAEAEEKIEEERISLRYVESTSSVWMIVIAVLAFVALLVGAINPTGLLEFDDVYSWVYVIVWLSFLIFMATAVRCFLGYMRIIALSHRK